MACCGLLCLKCLLYILNTILTIMSIVIVCVGAGVLHVMNQVESGSEATAIDFTNLSTAGIMIVVVGVLVVLFVFCGCCGAFLGAGWMLIWFAIIMGCLLITECVILGFAWKYSEPEKLHNIISQTYNALLDEAAKAQNAGKEVEVATSAVLSFLQDKLECCGAEGPKDYRRRNMDPTVYCASRSNSGTYSEGCTKVTEQFFEKNGHTMGGVVVGTMAFQLTAICLAIFLYFTIV